MQPPIASLSTIENTIAVLRRRGHARVALTGLVLDTAQGEALARSVGADGWFDAARVEARGMDALVIVEPQSFDLMMRRLERIFAQGLVIVPADAAWIVESRLRGISALDAAWTTTADANYLSRSGLRGHYLEFGVYWGRTFFPAYHRLRHWLDGDFYAFDSFCGLSTPLAEETRMTGGDFAEGSYFCNLPSFQTIGELCGIDETRQKLIPGFYSETLAGHEGALYGLAPKSVSICIIDCDLYEPTVDVLEFVAPLLDDGALIYFDDWRLCRASPHHGERRAALEWLRDHPEFELIDFPGDVPPLVSSWQHAWFIFQRR